MRRESVDKLAEERSRLLVNQALTIQVLPLHLSRHLSLSLSLSISLSLFPLSLSLSTGG